MRPALFPACFLAVATLCIATTACSPAESKNSNEDGANLIGIVQCDDYLSKVHACIKGGTLPDVKRALLIDETRELFSTWKADAANPEHRTTLPQACTITADVAREELAPLGCTL
ncbi:hypothetical protein [Lysobacter fragariae]